MNIIPQEFKINYQYPVYFTHDLFDNSKNYLKNIFDDCSIATSSKFLLVIDNHVAEKNESFVQNLKFFLSNNNYLLAGDPIIIQGGESSKNSFDATHKILEAINKYGIDRHSYVIGIGGGALLDVAGFAASIGHRGIRHIRIPTTVLSQNDSGVGVKNGINYFGKKNFVGTFTTPFLVINDISILKTLSDRDYRCGIAEAMKVALIKDADFFTFIQSNAEKLNQRDEAIIYELIYKCAALHMQHIASLDPFEKGNSRPLDYGHWSAHKLEQLSSNEILHGEAVVVGMCLDAVYANLIGLFDHAEMMQLINLSKKLNFNIYAPELELKNGNSKNEILMGLQEFREHLGGHLTIMLLNKIGVGTEVHEINEALVLKAIQFLKQFN